MDVVAIFDFVRGVNNDVDLWEWLVLWLRWETSISGYGCCLCMDARLKAFILCSLMSYTDCCHMPMVKLKLVHTCCIHLDAVRLFTGVADPHFVAGSYAKAVLAMWFKAWADPVRCVLTVGTEDTPVFRFSCTNTFHLYYVICDLWTAVVTRSAPGQN